MSDRRPRNRKGAAKAAREREALKTAMLTWARARPLATSLTAKDLRRITGLSISIRRVQQHVASIRLEADLEALDTEQLACVRRNQESGTGAVN